jgi:hypothetical protein
VGDLVETLGYRPHREATSHVLAADLLYLPTITRPDGSPVSNVPAKTYEYLGSGRPVAALAGPGDVRELAQGRERVALLGATDVEGLASLLVRVAEGTGPRACAPDPPDTSAWTRRALAGRMAGLLDLACRRASSPSGES